MSAYFLIIGLCLAQSEPTILAKVGDVSITAADLQLHLALRGVAGEPSPRVRAEAIQTLIERALIEQFLERRKTDAHDDPQLAIALVAAREALAEQGLDAIDEELLSRQLALPLAWRKYVQRVITDQRIRDYHARHKRELDGTRLRVSQIFLKYAEGEGEDAAPRTTQRLKDIRESIVSKEIAFAAAARKHSQAPTAKSGGDVGWIGPHGALPETVTRAAFSLETDEASEVILSPFGAHLVTVTDIEEGRLSLEDARPQIIAALSRALWRETVAAGRARTEIHMVD